MCVCVCVCVCMCVCVCVCVCVCCVCVQAHKWCFSPLDGGECRSRVALLGTFAHLPQDPTKFRTWLDLYGLGDEGLLQVNIIHM